MDLMHLIRIAITIFCIGMLICRIGKMSSQTNGKIKKQHSFLMGCLWLSLIVDDSTAPVLIVLGLAVFFAFSMKRWRHFDPSTFNKTNYQIGLHKNATADNANK